MNNLSVDSYYTDVLTVPPTLLFGHAVVKSQNMGPRNSLIKIKRIYTGNVSLSQFLIFGVTHVKR